MWTRLLPCPQLNILTDSDPDYLNTDDFPWHAKLFLTRIKTTIWQPFDPDLTDLNQCRF